MGGGITLDYATVGTFRYEYTGYLAYGSMIFSSPESQVSPLIERVALPLLAKFAPKSQQAPGENMADIPVTHDETWKERFAVDSKERMIGTAAQLNDIFKRGRKLQDPKFVSKSVFVEGIVKAKSKSESTSTKDQQDKENNFSLDNSAADTTLPTEDSLNQQQQKSISVPALGLFHSKTDKINSFYGSEMYYNSVLELQKVYHYDNLEPVVKFYKFEDFDHCYFQETIDRQTKVYNDTIEFLNLVLES